MVKGEYGIIKIIATKIIKELIKNNLLGLFFMFKVKYIIVKINISINVPYTANRLPIISILIGTLNNKI